MGMWLVVVDSFSSRFIILYLFENWIMSFPLAAVWLMESYLVNPALWYPVTGVVKPVPPVLTSNCGGEPGSAELLMMSNNVPSWQYTWVMAELHFDQVDSSITTEYWSSSGAGVHALSLPPYLIWSYFLGRSMCHGQKIHSLELLNWKGKSKRNALSLTDGYWL